MPIKKKPAKVPIKPAKRIQSFRFTVEMVGSAPDSKKLRALIEEARNEAVQESDGPKPKASVEAPGGLFGFGTEIVYLLHVSWPYIHAAGGPVGIGAATEAGRELFKAFANALRKRNILPSDPEISDAEVAPPPAKSTAKPNRKKKHVKSSHKK